MVGAQRLFNDVIGPGCFIGDVLNGVEVQIPRPEVTKIPVLIPFRHNFILNNLSRIDWDA